MVECGSVETEGSLRKYPEQRANHSMRTVTRQSLQDISLDVRGSFKEAVFGIIAVDNGVTV